MDDAPRIGVLGALCARIGAWTIYRLIWLFGRTRRWTEHAWLAGPLGGAVIGDAPYHEVAAAESLTVERATRDGGLIPDFGALRGEGFDPDTIHPLVRDFYERTATYAMDVWSTTHFPASVGLWLLVKTVSRQVNQLNFPLSPLDTARGMVSEVIALKRADGTLRYTGWFRTLAQQRLVLYTGFYLVERAPNLGVPCVKVVFPMPRGNATVVLRPQHGADRSLILDSSGRRFGDAGFYRVQARDAARARIWHIRTLKERFHVFVDEQGVLRCDHHVSFLGLPVLKLHYKIFKAAGNDEAAARRAAAS